MKRPTGPVLGIRERVLVIVALAIAALSAVQYIIARSAVVDRFESIELQQSRDDVRRVLSALDREIEQLDTLARDWAEWDDTYQFVADRNAAFVSSNFPDDILDSLNLDTIVISDRSGDVVLARSSGDGDGPRRALPPGLEPLVTGDGMLAGHDSPDGGVAGLVRLGNRPMIASSRPITTSESEGPVRGALLMGRFLDDEEVARLGGQTLIDVHAHPWGIPAAEPGLHSAMATLSTDEPVLVDNLSDSRRAVYGLVEDVTGEPALVIHAQMGRPLLQQGRETAAYLLWSLLSTGAVLCLITLLLLERLVVRRARTLAREVSAIDLASPAGTSQVSVTGDDELAMLARTVNAMLERLRSSHDSLHHRQRELEALHVVSDTSLTVGSLEEAANRVVRRLRKVTGFPLVMLHFWDPAAENAPRRAVAGEEAAFGPLVEEEVQAIRREVTRRGNMSPRLQTVQSGDVKFTYAGFPMFGEGRLVGVLSFVDPGRQGHDERFWNTARSLANYIAMMMERWRAREEAEYRAFHDALTGLPNRALFMERLRHALQQAPRCPGQMLAVLFVDADRFKAVNDTLGHASGDAYLKELAKRLRESVRDADTVARLGGDEYAVLLEDLAGPADAVQLARRILEALKEPLELDEQPIRMSASIGIALGGAGQSSAQQLLQNADLAMYRAKSRGGGSCEMYDIGMQAAALRRLKMEMELRQALIDGQIGMLYEPVIELGSGRVVALDALLDWRPPGRVSIAPTEVAGLARESGLDVDLDQWKLSHGIMRLAGWRRENLLTDTRLAVGISPRSIANSGFLDSLRRVVRANGLDGNALVLQISWTTAEYHAETAAQTRGVLQELGVDCWFERFSIGSLSLRSLRALPVTMLKIDLAELREVGDEDEAALLLRAVGSLATGLGLGWIAAGIESETQLAQVRELGCVAAQGPALAAPVQAAKVPSQLRQLSDVLSSGKPSHVGELS